MLDIRTMIACAGAVVAILAMFMLLYRFSQKTYPGFGLWTLSCVLGTAGFILLSLRGVVPDLVSISLGNIVIASVSVIRANAFRSFFSIAPWRYTAAVLLGATGIWVVVFQSLADIPSLRNVGLTMALLICLVFILHALARGFRSVRSPLYPAMALLYVVFTTLMIVRAAVWLANPDHYSLLQPTLLNVVFFLMAIVFDIGWSFLFLMFNTDRQARELTALNGRLAELAAKDPLTGLYNRRTFFERAETEFRRRNRYGGAIAMIMADLDLFKNINDSHGHGVGDAALVHVSSILSREARCMDVVARYGGEEFIILLPQTGLSPAAGVAERIRRAVESAVLKYADLELRFTMSFGVAVSAEGQTSVDDLVRCADAALYRAKKSGRNAVITDESCRE